MYCCGLDTLRPSWEKGWRTESQGWEGDGEHDSGWRVSSDFPPAGKPPTHTPTHPAPPPPNSYTQNQPTDLVPADLQ